MDKTSKKVIIVGGGLVGALNAIYLARRGFQVEIYERRADIRKEDFVRGRSINLALSCRGREALRALGLEEEITNTGIPMYARMIHDLDGTRRPIPYGKGDQHIMSIDRRKLNEVLLTAAERESDVKIFFSHRLVSANLDEAEATFVGDDEKEVSTRGALIMGCDGAYSSVRKQLMKSTRFDFSQEYIPHGYMELSIPAKDGKFNMEVNYLHIWPRNEYMMIALPNTEDHSFVLTLFMPFNIFDSIKTEEQVQKFFEEEFPDSIPLIGRENLINDVMNSKALPMVSVKCSPYHYKDKVVIMGDAAHAMVPFYGQGMNCGFEDCLVFDQLMEKNNNNLAISLEEYSTFRNPDAKAMCDLAMYNYVEMRSLVNSKMFLLRKKVDNLLNWLLPSTWVPLYTMVSFTRTRYHECIAKKAWQDRVIQKIITVGSVTVLGGSALYFAHLSKKHDINIFETLQSTWRQFSEKVYSKI